MKSRTREYLITERTTKAHIIDPNRWYGNPDAHRKCLQHYEKLWTTLLEEAETRAQLRICKEILILIYQQAARYNLEV